MATAEPLSTPISRLHMKKPDPCRQSRSKSSDGRRKTAAERLEADKQKYYVKHAEARQKRNSPDTASSPLRNVQSTGALSHYATAAVGGKNENRSGIDIINVSVSTQGQFKEQRRTKLNRSNTDADVAGRNLNRFRTRSTTEQTINSLQAINPSITSSQSDKTKEQSSELISKRSRSPKDGRNPKSISSYLNRAKEGLKSVTSSLAGTGGVENSKTRQSRSAVANSSRQRSHSAGANVQRHLNTRLHPSQLGNDEILAVSPRTQLKNARQNLKKVSQTDEKKTSAQAKLRGKTFVVVPKQNENVYKERAITQESEKLPQNLSCTSFSSQRSFNQPLSTIDNTVSGSRFKVSSINQLSHKQEESAFSRLQASKPAKEDDKSHKVCDVGTPVIASETNNHTLSAFERLKGASQCSETTTQQKITTAQSALFAPIQDSTTSHLSNHPRQRKSGSRPTGSDLKKSSNRVSFNEESLTTRPESRKSLTEALEEIINPPEREDDIDTAYHSMSPDASVEFKTLLATTNQLTGDRNPVTTTTSSGANIRGSRSKTPESSRSRTPTLDDGLSLEANDVDLRSAKDSDFALFLELSKSGKSSMTSSSHHKQCNSTNNESLADKRQGTNKLNHESDAGTVSLSVEPPNSTKLAPKERKEVAPDISLSKTENRDYLNTIKSQNTSSSASGDMNKPLTALTAADLKPRGGLKMGLPLKPSFPYPIDVSNYRGNPKRPNNTPVSPTMSPNKQPARMTPSQGSSSSTPYSSLKRTPASSHNSSLKRNRQRSKSDVSILQSELDRFFSTMGMDDPLMSPLPVAHDTLFTTAPFGSESDFSFAGASAYVRESLDDSMEVDPAFGGLANTPSVSIIEKHARIVRWLRSCHKPPNNTSPRSARRAPPAVPPRPPPIPDRPSSQPPPIPPRLSSHPNLSSGATKVSDV